MSWGVFKGIYKGQGIYWSGTYSIEGRGGYKTMQEARDAVDVFIEQQEQADCNHRMAQIEKGAIKAVREGNTVTVYLPDGPQSMTIHQYRREVFSIEERYSASVVMV